MKTKIFLTILLIVSNLFWFSVFAYKSLDAGISLTYLRDSYDLVHKGLKQALIIANTNLVGKPLSEVKTIIPTDVYGSEPFMKEGCWVVANLCLKVDKYQRVIRVQSLMPQ